MNQFFKKKLKNKQTKKKNKGKGNSNKNKTKTKTKTKTKIKIRTISKTRSNYTSPDSFSLLRGRSLICKSLNRASSKKEKRKK